jgi:hypothetical protein
VESPLFRVSAALGIHLIVYCAIGAGLAFGLYALLQPSRTPNSGLALYKPPPAAPEARLWRQTAQAIWTLEAMRQPPPPMRQRLRNRVAPFTWDRQR